MRTIFTALLLALGGAGIAPGAQAAPACSWQAAWASAQMSPDAANAMPAAGMNGATLRQIVRPTLGAGKLRVRFSNAFGRTPLVILGAGLARSADNRSDRIDVASRRMLTFAGAAGITIPPGADWLSDPVTLDVKAFDDLAISLRARGDPASQTAHPGSRATSYVAAGDQIAAATLTGATPVDHWYMLSGVEVERCAPANGIVTLGDSITDGHGATTNGNDRWPDVLARRLGGGAAVLNQGIGGNRVLLDGLGPNALARLDRDVLAQPGVRYVLVLEGINDLGVLTRLQAKTPAERKAFVTQLTAGYAQIVARGHARGLKVYGATITPDMGSGYYHPDAGSEADRQAINAWIRAPGHFDAVVDFDRVTRDPADPSRLAPAFDSGDHLHPNPAGYKAMGEAVPLALFR
ncbi:SGNH/GDSL hydrolase family protein [Sphingomonas sp. H39-1-10]|uniref:SGNH/GDSL hydrolase family protein n=1 Tax=Sphingomonas pollutisoli TaxID=3030829 RepID=UPI0023B91A1B|nr:SGNH/GDSL hydrolase family protein [Sphingomonas pollutisoli]MDF0489754.1 SGNH/GDSL hydrolase family protein [Sphingomonas pollutisoli]